MARSAALFPIERELPWNRIDPFLKYALAQPGYVPHPLFWDALDALAPSSDTDECCRRLNGDVCDVLVYRLAAACPFAYVGSNGVSYRLVALRPSTQYLGQVNGETVNTMGGQRAFKVMFVGLAHQVLPNTASWERLVARERVNKPVYMTPAQAAHFAIDTFFRLVRLSPSVVPYLSHRWWAVMARYHEQVPELAELLKVRIADRIRPFKPFGCGDRRCFAKLLDVKMDLARPGLVFSWQRTHPEPCDTVESTPGWYQPHWPAQRMQTFMNNFVKSRATGVTDGAQLALVLGMHPRVGRDSSVLRHVVQSDLGDRNVLRLVSQFAWEHEAEDFAFGKCSKRPASGSDTEDDNEPAPVRRRLN